MDFRDTPEEAAFRQEVRESIAREAPKLEDGTGMDVRGYAQVFVQSQGWFKKLGEKGWIAPAWPKEYGGAGMTVMQQFIFNEEMAEARAPRPLHLIIGVGMAGPTRIVHGTEEQKKYYLPRILSGHDIWCQGYSEPEAGSDLASLRTRAIRDGDDYIINGQKIWTTIAHLAKWMILLARTDPDAPKHKGITYFILDMKSPGVEVRPLVNMAGGHEFNEVFFDNVSVPKTNIIGEENRGWYVGVTLLDFERSNISGAITQRRNLTDLIKYLKSDKGAERSQGRAELTRDKIADRWIESEVMFNFSFRIASMQASGVIPNYEASTSKIWNSELHQRSSNTGMKAFGLYANLWDRDDARTPLDGRFTQDYVHSVVFSIFGGSNEIQRNVIGERVLGLPGDVRVDRDVPWSQVPRN